MRIARQIVVFDAADLTVESTDVAPGDSPCTIMRWFAPADGTVIYRVAIARLRHDDSQRQPVDVLDVDRRAPVEDGLAAGARAGR